MSRWSVSLSVVPAEVEALRAAADAGVRFEDVDGLAGVEVVLDAEGADRDAAVRGACAALTALRRRAGLPEAGARVVAVLAEDTAERQRALLDEAHALREAGHHGWAVAAAQAACELRCRTVLADLAARHGALGAVAERFAGGANPANERVRRVLHALGGPDPADEPWWHDFLAHAQRRNRIVHEGAETTPEHSAASLRAAEALIAWLDAR